MFAKVADQIASPESDNHAHGRQRNLSQHRIEKSVARFAQQQLPGDGRSDAGNDPGCQHDDLNRPDAGQAASKSCLKGQGDQEPEGRLADHAAGDENDGRQPDPGQGGVRKNGSIAVQRIDIARIQKRRVGEAYSDDFQNRIEIEDRQQDGDRKQPPERMAVEIEPPAPAHAVRSPASRPLRARRRHAGALIDNLRRLSRPDPPLRQLRPPVYGFPKAPR